MKAGPWKLKVHRALSKDVYKDVARIHRSKRAGIKAGQVCWISACGKKCLVAVRGMPESKKGGIRIDEVTRVRLGVTPEEEFDFTIVEAGFGGRLLWALQASDPALRIATGIAVISLILGLLSVVLAFPF